MTAGPTTETHCHCKAHFKGSDHCPFCGCEQYERYCDADAAEQREATRSWCPGDATGPNPVRLAQPEPHEGHTE